MHLSLQHDKWLLSTPCHLAVPAHISTGTVTAVHLSLLLTCSSAPAMPLRSLTALGRSGLVRPAACSVAGQHFAAATRMPRKCAAAGLVDRPRPGRQHAAQLSVSSRSFASSAPALMHPRDCSPQRTRPGPAGSTPCGWRRARPGPPTAAARGPPPAPAPAPRTAPAGSRTCAQHRTLVLSTPAALSGQQARARRVSARHARRCQRLAALCAERCAGLAEPGAVHVSCAVAHPLSPNLTIAARARTGVRVCSSSSWAAGRPGWAQAGWAHASRSALAPSGTAAECNRPTGRTAHGWTKCRPPSSRHRMPRRAGAQPSRAAPPPRWPPRAPSLSRAPAAPPGHRVCALLPSAVGDRQLNFPPRKSTIL
jgi:hypothetical protein